MQTAKKLDAKSYLEYVQHLLLYFREQIEIIRSSLMNTAIELTHDRVQSSPNVNKMLDSISRIIDFENKLARETKAAFNFINQLDKEIEREILILFYIQDAKIIQIAEKLKISRRHVYRIHDAALVQLNEYVGK